MTDEPAPRHPSAWTPPAPPGGPPPGPPPPGPPPPGPFPPGGAPPPGAPGPPKRSRGPWPAILAVVALAAVIAIVGSTVVIVQARHRDQREEEEELEARALEDDRADLESAIIDGDTDAVVQVVDRRAELLDDPETLEVDGSAEELEVTDLGYVVAEVRLEEGTEYVVDAAGDEPSLVLLAPGEDDAQVVETSISAEEPGRHTLLVAADRGDAATLSISAVRTEEFTLTTDDVLEPYTLDEGEVLDLTFDVEQGEVYEWGLEDGRVQAVLLDGGGATVDTTAQDDMTARFVPAADDRYRIRVMSDTGVDEPFEVDAYQLAHYSAYYGNEGDAVFLASDPEPESFLPPGDDAANLWRFCFFVREDVEINYRINPSVAGATYDLREFDDDATTPFNTLEGVEGDLLETGPADDDFRSCFEVVPTSPISSSPSVSVTEA